MSDTDKVKKSSVKDAAKPRGKSSAYNFYVKSCKGKETSGKKNAGEKDGRDLLKRCSEEWKKMTDKQKAEFKALAEKDKIRYEKEMANYEPSSPDTNVEEKKRKRPEKDPNAPKKPIGAFFLFSNDHRDEVKKSLPDGKGTDVAVELGSRWKELADEEKAKYHKQAEKCKEIYLVEMAKYKKLKGEDADDNKENDA